MAELIYVCATDGTPLMPTHRLGKVARWLKSGRAHWAHGRRDTIILTDVQKHVQPLTLGIDAGFSTIGESVVDTQNHREVYAAEFSHVKGEKQRNDQRRMYRQMRRSRLRHRQARFNNRKKPIGWYAPSIQHKLDNHLKEIQRIKQFLPIQTVIVEAGVFDNHKLTNPKVHGKAYQEGPMAGYHDVKSYVYTRDNHRCAVCGHVFPESQLRAHHLLMRHDGGTNNPANLITVCVSCHNGANHLSNGPLKQLEQNAQLAVDQRGAFFINAVHSWLPQQTKVMLTSGYITARYRRQYEVTKSHHDDAFVIAGGTDADERVNEWHEIQKLRHNNRSLSKFYDAKFVDIRNGAIKSGQELSSGRTMRRLDVNYDNQRLYRGEQVRQGHWSIRRNHYQIRPGDKVLTRYGEQTAMGVNSNGANVLFKMGGKTKSQSVKTIICLHHLNGWQEAIQVVNKV